MKLDPSIVFSVLAALAFASAVGRPVVAQTTTWLPLSRTTREADALFLPDLSSAEAIEASGGFLHGRHRETLAEVRSLFEFGQGRFGPAVRVRAEDRQYYWVWFPLDGLIPADEFTIQFWAKSDRPWTEEVEGTFFRLASRENEIALRIHEGQFQVDARSPSSKGSWKASIGQAGLAPVPSRLLAYPRFRSRLHHGVFDARSRAVGFRINCLVAHTLRRSPHRRLGRHPTDRPAWRAVGTVQCPPRVEIGRR
jgi:hypothetical protein